MPDATMITEDDLRSMRQTYGNGDALLRAVEAAAYQRVVQYLADNGGMFASGGSWEEADKTLNDWIRAARDKAWE